MTADKRAAGPHKVWRTRPDLFAEAASPDAPECVAKARPGEPPETPMASPAARRGLWLGRRFLHRARPQSVSRGRHAPAFLSAREARWFRRDESPSRRVRQKSLKLCGARELR